MKRIRWWLYYHAPYLLPLKAQLRCFLILEVADAIADEMDKVFLEGLR